VIVVIPVVQPFTTLFSLRALNRLFGTAPLRGARLLVDPTVWLEAPVAIDQAVLELPEIIIERYGTKQAARPGVS
jgi:hypothetical protein